MRASGQFQSEGDQLVMGLIAPVPSKADQAIDVIEMHAVAAREVERGEFADGDMASGTLPARPTLAVVPVPIVLES